MTSLINNSKSTLFVAAAVAVVSFASARVDAALIVVSNNVVFDSIVASMNGSVLHEDFDNYDGFYASGLAGGSGDSSWVATADGGLYAIPGIMSTNLAGRALTLSFASDNVFALGGDFFNTDINFGDAGGLVELAVAGVSYVYSAASDTDFAGFLSTSGSIDSITFVPFGPAGASTYASARSVSVGVIPSPAVLALGALAGVVTRRRRN